MNIAVLKRFLLPAFLALLNALFWFAPSREFLVGWGGDPAFNVWTLEEVWRHLNRFGPSHLFSFAMWQDPILYPLPWTHALSENMLYAGLLSWPVRLLTANGVLTMNLLAMAMTLTAFACAGLWLRKLGIQKLCWWGALVFCACGWLQSQCTHYQNICIFLFPLAFWLWLRFVEKPTVPRLLLSAAAFGWIGGWNLYFQVFSNLIFAVLVVRHWIKAPSSRRKLIALCVLVGLIELPILLPYFKLEALIGTLGIGLDDFRDNSAGILSFLSHARETNLLGRILPFYPKVHLGIEASGFVGLTWIVLAVLSARKKELRLWLWLALIAYVVSLGPDFILMHLLRMFPGFGSLRAVGRVQLLVLIASLPAIFKFLESQAGWRRTLPLALILLELLPGEAPAKIRVPASLYASPTAFSQAVRSLPDRSPLLVIPGVDSNFELYATQFENPLYDGYTGRYPANQYILHNLLTSSQPVAERALQALELTGAHWVVSLSPADTESLRARSFLAFQGCYSHFDLSPCLFKAKAIPKLARLRLDRDAEWEYPPQKKGHLGILRVRRDGILDYDPLGTCRLVVSLKFPFLPEISVDNTLTGVDFHGFRYKAGDIVTRQRSPQAIFSLPPPWRPGKRYEVRCQPWPPTGT